MSKIEDSRDRDGALTWELKPAFHWFSLLILILFWLSTCLVFLTNGAITDFGRPILWLLGLVWGWFAISVLVGFVWGS
ncbi:MAG: hypothetical protein KDM63_18440, partial [Verrucomicrobiae bacterium]|nr:hypothetical protein [Verrucomicrobiae bacterium]